MIKTYDIEVDCANCALKVENALKNIENIINVSVNYMTQKMVIESNTEIPKKELLKIARKIEPDFEIN